MSSSRELSARLPRSTRRCFLGGLASSVGLASAGAPLTSRGARVWELEAVATNATFGDGVTLTYPRYRPLAGGEMRGGLPFLEAVEGEAATLRIENRLPIDFRPLVVGADTGVLLRSGGSGSFSFTMPAAGSYLLSAAWPGSHHLVGGLAAMLVSRPTNGLNQLWRGGPAYDREYVLLYEDSDSRAMPLTTPSGPPRLPYEPNYFTLNGLSFPERASDADSRVAATLGERVLIRFGNLGRMRQSIHFHGFHVQIVARDNVPETALPPKDTIPVPHATTVDVILTPHQRGLYPLHPHSLTAVTDNGNYPAGQLTFTEVT